MTSPARRHYLRESARIEAAETVDLAALTPYRRLQYQLHQDRTALKLIQSIQDKARAKAAMLPAYAEWVQGVLASDNPSPDDAVFTTTLIWLIDTGALDAAVPLAEFAIRHQLHSADDYQRSLPTIIFEQTAEQLTAGHPLGESGLAALLSLVLAKNSGGSHQVDMPDAVRAKFLKAAGIWHSEFGSKDRAADLLDRAIAYDPRVGAKQLLKEVRSALQKNKDS